MSVFTLEKADVFAQECRDFLSNYVPFDGDRCFVAGGFFQRFWHSLPIRDIDIYCKEDYMEECVQELMSVGFKKILVRKDFVRFDCGVDDMEIDVIGFHRPRSIDYVTQCFDFTVCMVSMDGENMYAGPHYKPTEFIEHIATKQLIFNYKCILNLGSNNLLTRLKKYLDMGYTIEDYVLTEMHLKLIDADRRNLQSMKYPG